MIWVGIRSRWANWLLIVLGATYSIAGLTLLVWLSRETWGAAGLTDRALQLALVGTVCVGAWMAANSLRNERVSLPRMRVKADERAATS